MHSLLFTALAAITAASPNYTYKDRILVDPASGQVTGGVKINDLQFDSGVWTGWVYVEEFNVACFDVSFTRSAATSVSMRCETAESHTTTADAGYDVHELDVFTGTANSYPMTWTYTTSASAKWSWCVSYLPAKYLNCRFVNAGGGASDKVTVTVKGVAP